MNRSKDDRPTIDGEVARYLKEMRIPLRLAATTESGWPLVLSLWYVLDSGKLWCATQNTAKIVHYLEADSRCAFEVASEQPPYRGVRGQGRVRLSSERGEEVLETLLDRYLGGRDSPLARRLLAKRETEVAIEITPVTLFVRDCTQRMRGSVAG
jgi:nitroimidazol reductase NimA-like FMN-containing flavoprotein (pyridoxamine 5'-phosphate oxidase superfamily)